MHLDFRRPYGLVGQQPRQRQLDKAEVDQLVVRDRVGDGLRVAPIVDRAPRRPDEEPHLYVTRNPEQLRAVTHGDGPLLILAGNSRASTGNRCL